MKPFEFKLKMHSIVEAITNSSTVIYTNHDGCVGPAKKLINEFIKAFGLNGTCSDFFFIDSFMDSEEYTNHDDFRESLLGLDENCGWREIGPAFDALRERILVGEVERPEWMTEIEADLDDDYESNSDSSLMIRAKDWRYNKLASAMYSFLTSPHVDASYDS